MERHLEAHEKHCRVKGWLRKEITSKTEKELTEREGNQGTMTQQEPMFHARQELETHMVRR